MVSCSIIRSCPFDLRCNSGDRQPAAEGIGIYPDRQERLASQRGKGQTALEREVFRCAERGKYSKR